MSETPTGLDLGPFMSQCQARVQSALDKHLTSLPAAAPRLQQSMRYATLQGGKRVRPVLAYAATRACGGELADADTAACAIELVHCYSLVHDDLPAMDDDALRRGKPTVHIAFDEATAILTGDALQAMAFRLLSSEEAYPVATRLQMVTLLSQAAGYEGMVAGQAIDFDAMGKTLTLAELENMHSLKTGALISTSVQLGALASGNATGPQLGALRRYAACIGLAFQIRDDILDVVSDTQTLGKTSGADQALNKPTYVSLLGLQGARDKAQALCDNALEVLLDFDERADALRAIASYIVERSH